MASPSKPSIAATLILLSVLGGCAADEPADSTQSICDSSIPVACICTGDSEGQIGLISCNAGEPTGCDCTAANTPGQSSADFCSQATLACR
ncbi:MAG: hypothetical protein AAFQ82_26525, partial [Myxococcota bacterium]